MPASKHGHCFPNVASCKADNEDINKAGEIHKTSVNPSNSSLESSTSSAREPITALPKLRRVRPVSIQFLDRGVKAMERHSPSDPLRGRSFDKPLPAQPEYNHNLTLPRGQGRKGRPSNKSPFKMFSSRSTSKSRERSPSRATISAPFGAAKGVPPTNNIFATDDQEWEQLESVEPRDPNLRHASDPTQQDIRAKDIDLMDGKSNLLPRSTSMFSFTSFSSLVGQSLGNIFKGRSNAHPGSAFAKKAKNDPGARGASSFDVSSERHRLLNSASRQSDRVSNFSFPKSGVVAPSDDTQTLELISKSPKLQKFFFGSSSLFATPKRQQSSTAYGATDANGSPSKARRSMYNLGYQSLESTRADYEKAISSDPNVCLLGRRPATSPQRDHTDEEPLFRFSNNTKAQSSENSRPSTQDGSSSRHVPSAMRSDEFAHGMHNRANISEFGRRGPYKVGSDVSSAPDSGSRENLTFQREYSMKSSDGRFDRECPSLTKPKFEELSYKRPYFANSSHENSSRENSLAKASNEMLNDVRKKGLQSSERKPQREFSTCNDLAQERTRRFDETVSGLRQHPNVLEMAESYDWYKFAHKQDLLSTGRIRAKSICEMSNVANQTFNDYTLAPRPKGIELGKMPSWNNARLNRGPFTGTANFQASDSEKRRLGGPQFDERVSGLKQHSHVMEFAEPPEWYRSRLDRIRSPGRDVSNSQTNGQSNHEPIGRAAETPWNPSGHQLIEDPLQTNAAEMPSISIDRALDISQRTRAELERSTAPTRTPSSSTSSDLGNDAVAGLDLKTALDEIHGAPDSDDDQASSFAKSIVRVPTPYPHFTRRTGAFIDATEPTGLTPPPRHPGRLNPRPTQASQNMRLATHNAARHDDARPLHGNFSMPCASGSRWPPRFPPLPGPVPPGTAPAPAPRTTPPLQCPTPHPSPRMAQSLPVVNSVEGAGGAPGWAPEPVSYRCSDDIGRAE